MLKSLLVIAIFTAFTVFAWIGFTIHHNITTSTISEDVNIRTEPITDSFDLQTFEKLKSRTNIPANLEERIIQILPSPTIQPISGSASGQLTPPALPLTPTPTQVGSSRTPTPTR